MPEHMDVLPLWDRSDDPDRGYGSIQPGALGLTAEFEDRLREWNSRYEATSLTNFEWPSDAALLAFLIDGHLLARDVQRQLGPGVVVLNSEADEGRGPSPLPRIAEQLRAMSDAEFATLTRGADISRHEWTPGRAPERVLVAPQPTGLTLLDRSPVMGRPSDRLDGRIVLSQSLAARLSDWNRRCLNLGEHSSLLALGDERACALRCEGHELAGAVQEELGPRITVLFPEASRNQSEPSPEMLAFVERIRSLG